jgi:spore germination protein KA
MKKKEKIMEFIPEWPEEMTAPGNGVTIIGDLEFGPDGLLWGASQGYIFAMNPDTMEIVKSKIVGEFNYAGTGHFWMPRHIRFDTDGLLYPAAVEEFVTGSRPTPFPLLQYTERTDRFCQGILEGRVGLIIDGLPLGYLAPVDVGYFMESPEDNGIDYISASCIRVLRYGALFLSLLLPGVFVAMAIHHQEMIPLPLLRSIIESMAYVPFSTVVEVLGLLIAFELLQESGIHLPRAIGQSVSIIGGIVIGSAAVEAKIISPAALITVSVAGICGFVQPNRDFAEAVRIWRFLIAVFGALAGLFGVTAGLLALIIHLSGLTSLGVSYLAPYAKLRARSLLRPRLKREQGSVEE